MFSCPVVPDSSATPSTVAHQASLFKGFPRQEYWSRSLFPSPGDLPHPGTESTSTILCRFFIAETPGEPHVLDYWIIFLAVEKWKRWSFFNFTIVTVPMLHHELEVLYYDAFKLKYSTIIWLSLINTYHYKSRVELFT